MQEWDELDDLDVSDDTPLASLDDVLESLGRAEQPRAVDLPALSGLTAKQVEQLAQALVVLPEPVRTGFYQRLRDIAEDNGEYDFDAAFRLGLDDAEELARTACVEGLWECEERWWLRQLLVMVAQDGSTTVRAAASEALGRFVVLGEFDELRPADVDALRTALLERVADGGEAVEVRRLALEAVGANSSDDVQQLITRQHASREREMRLGAVHAMGRSLDPRWIGTLLEELGSDDGEMRFEAVTALGQVGDPSVSTSILPLLADEDSTDVQLAAVTALGQIGGPLAIKQLTAVLDHADEAMRAAAEDALEQAQFNADPLGFSVN